MVVFHVNCYYIGAMPCRCLLVFMPEKCRFLCWYSLLLVYMLQIFVLVFMPVVDEDKEV